MKKEGTVSYVLRLALTLLIITGVVAALLAGVNAITAPRIAAATAEKTRLAIAAVLPGAEDPQPVTLGEGTDAAIQAVYSAEILTSDGSNAKTLCYAVEVHPNGFGGELTMMVGVDSAGKVLGISIVSHSETAGLGAVAASDTSKGQAFRDQFVGQSGQLAVTKDGGTIDALSSATITSRAVTEGVNTALAWVAGNG